MAGHNHTLRTTVFDTSAVIGLIERRSAQLVALTSDLGRPIVRSTTVYGELRHGAATSPDSEQRAGTLDRYLQLSVWPDGEYGVDELAELYGIVSATSSEPDLRAGMNDRWVIAECLAYGADLVTADQRQADLATASAHAAGVDLRVTAAA